MRFIRKINDFPYSIFESGSILTIGLLIWIAPRSPETHSRN